MFPYSPIQNGLAGLEWDYVAHTHLLFKSNEKQILVFTSFNEAICGGKIIITNKSEHKKVIALERESIEKKKNHFKCEKSK